MRYFISGLDITLAVDFKVNGELVAADAESVSYVLRGNDGSVMTQGSLSTLDGATAVSIPVLSGRNNIIGSIEKRSIIVNFQVDGQSYSLIEHYRLIPWVDITASAEDVRSFIGVNDYELPAENVDLFSAYGAVKEKVANLDAQLVGAKQILANNAVVWQAALDVIPSLQLRIAKMERRDDLQWQRLSKIDFDGLRQNAAASLSDAIATMTGIPENDTTLMIVGTPRDPVTNQ